MRPRSISATPRSSPRSTGPRPEAAGLPGAFAFFAGGAPLTARRALDIGLVQEVVAPEDLMKAADAWCDRIAAMPPHAIAMAKPLLRQAADATWDTTITMEEFAEPNCFTTGAFQQTVRSMTEGP